MLVTVLGIVGPLTKREHPKKVLAMLPPTNCTFAPMLQLTSCVLPKNVVSEFTIVCL